MDTKGVGEWQDELGECDGQISTTIIKQGTNENLLNSSGNSTQCSVVIWVRRKSKKEGTYVF